ncbi:6462_t:CDS:1, partial [Funneliformis mosseae]
TYCSHYYGLEVLKYLSLLPQLVIIDFRCSANIAYDRWPARTSSNNEYLREPIPKKPL